MKVRQALTCTFLSQLPHSHLPLTCSFPGAASPAFISFLLPQELAISPSYDYLPHHIHFYPLHSFLDFTRLSRFHLFLPEVLFCSGIIIGSVLPHPQNDERESVHRWATTRPDRREYHGNVDTRASLLTIFAAIILRCSLHVPITGGICPSTRGGHSY